MRVDKFLAAFEKGVDKAPGWVDEQLVGFAQGPLSGQITCGYLWCQNLELLLERAGLEVTGFHSVLGAAEAVVFTLFRLLKAVERGSLVPCNLLLSSWTIAPVDA